MRPETARQAAGELLNGRLSAAEAAACRDALDNPEGAAALAWEGAIRDAVRDTADTAIDERRGYAQVWARIERDRKIRRTPPFASLRARLAGWFRASPAFAVACAVIAVQAGVIASLWPRVADEPEYAIVRALPSPAGHYEPFIRVTFAPSTSERALRALLVRVSAEIVAGPNSLGDYYLLVAPGQAPGTATVLRASPLVETAELVDALPGGD